LLAASEYYTLNLDFFYSLSACEYCPGFVLPKSGFIYLETILLFFNLVVPFFVYGLYKILKHKSKYVLLVPLLIVFFYFQITYLKEERYLLPVFPFIALISAYGFSFFKRKYLVLAAYCALSLAALPFFVSGGDFYQEFFMNDSYECDVVITSDPHTALNYKTVFPYLYDSDWSSFDSVVHREGDCVFYASLYPNSTNEIEFVESLGYEKVYFEDRHLKYAVFKLKNAE